MASANQSRRAMLLSWGLAGSLSGAVALAPGQAWAVCASPPGDVNGSGTSNVADAMCAILGSLWALSGGIPAEMPACLGSAPQGADVNCSGGTDVNDVLVVIQLVLYKALPLVIDANANACADACDALIAAACCAEGAGPGCGFDSCEGCVCGWDDYCCEIAWDASCVATARSSCESTCACPQGSGDCCAPHSEPGCADAACSDAVCDLDAFCCELGWDAACVACAAQGVGLGGLDCAAALAACSCPAPGACCLAGGCAMALSTACAAMGGAFAAGATCADAGGNGAADACEMQGSSCPGAGGPCLSAHVSPGCEDVPCCASVCSADPYCCQAQWDATCAALASDLCATPTACCTGTQCALSTPVACVDAGGSPLAGHSCGDANGDGMADACAPPAAACCLPTGGGCVMGGATACAQQGGAFYAGKSCADTDASGTADVCEPWACCTAGGGCSPMRPVECAGSGGSWQLGYDCSDQDGNAAADVCQDAGCCASAAPAKGCAGEGACTTCVCGQDSYCCTAAWDDLCALCAAGKTCGTAPQPNQACAAACDCSIPEPASACCGAGGCTMATTSACTSAGGLPAPGLGCFDVSGNGEPDVCEEHACCGAGGCTMTSYPACSLQEGNFAFGSTCADANSNGVADACE